MKAYHVCVYGACTCYLQVALFSLYTLTKLVEFVLFCVFLLFSKHTCTPAVASHTCIAIVYIVYTTTLTTINASRVIASVNAFWTSNEKGFKRIYFVQEFLTSDSSNQRLNIQQSRQIHDCTSIILIFIRTIKMFYSICNATFMCTCYVYTCSISSTYDHGHHEHNVIILVRVVCARI